MAAQHAVVSNLDVLKILGATHLAKKKIELHTAVRKGLPFSSFEALLKAADVTQKQLAFVLGIPDRTLARRKTDRQLTAVESDRLYRVAKVIAHATSVLGSLAKARTWFARPNRALGGELPLTLLDTDIGVCQVGDALAHIDYGIYS